jgi:hypothetical protein
MAETIAKKFILKVSADRWCKYRDIILGILKGLSDLEL